MRIGYSLLYSLPAYRFGMTAEKLNYIELLADGWNDDENYANDVEYWRLVRFCGIKRQMQTFSYQWFEFLFRLRKEMYYYRKEDDYIASVIGKKRDD